MAELKTIVPPLELCKKIPEGCFADSALVWNTTVCDEETGEICGVHERDFCDSFMLGNQVPAPTLEEIIADLPRSVCAEGQAHYLGLLSDTESSRWKICYSTSSFYGLAVLRSLCATDDNLATAALKLWLELKENENA